ncbi:acyl-CoA dehydrogenase family protein [Williamsia phyllosphaerae]|uniref:Acyl-CoA dehydrogenase n=1 Tax=Williamsia phyllosphaerae TaxID=885042 RepID=A0ABQ1V1N5_9NOCA|nr:acyl-CoA dehydrogenase family protein [Williamsia phyllosphaerae]GGF34892.1 acyl-CoA dehydrogenase [Williamsia phyllosphaerae]
MNLDLNDDQQLLFDTVHAAVGRDYGTGGRAAATSTELGWNQRVWDTLAEMGLIGLTIADEHGGSGAGPVELYATLEAIGRHAATEPLLDGVVLPAWLIAALGTPTQAKELLGALAAGEFTVAVAHAEPTRAWDAAPAVTVTVHDDGTATVSGVKSPVLHADQAQKLLVTVTDTDGRTHVVIVDSDSAGITRTDGRTSDWTHASQVAFEQTPAVLLGDTPEQSDVVGALHSAFAQARIAVTGEAIGLMEAGLTQTVDYLKSRKQFGVPLSSFQALVHRAADLYAQVELARSMALRATAVAEAVTAENTEGVDLRETADDAFVYVCDAATTVAEEIIQLHGGIGMTYESEVGHHAARLIGLTAGFGGVSAARRRAVASDTVLRAPSALLNNADAVHA